MILDENRMCTRCVFDDTVKHITFDKDGICNYCHINKKLAKKPDQVKLDRLFARIKKKMRNKKYDCIVPLSGGIDSTYVLYYIKKRGLNPVAVHSDNGWVTEVARENMNRVCTKLEVPLIRLSEDWSVMKDLYLASFKASVPDLCLACEVKSISEIMSFSVKESIPYIFFGFSSRTEGLIPLSWHYIDYRYFNSIIGRFAKNSKVCFKLNKLSFFHFFYFMVIKSIKFILLPTYVDWDEKKITKTLKNELDWIDKGHHSDCLYHPVVKYIQKQKFYIDRRKKLFCSYINRGTMTKEKAIELLKEPDDQNIHLVINQVISKLGITKSEFEEFLSLEPKYFVDYPSYYPFYKKMRFLIWLVNKCGLMDEGIYKYYFPNKWMNTRIRRVLKSR